MMYNTIYIMIQNKQQTTYQTQQHNAIKNETHVQYKIKWNCAQQNTT